MHRANIIGVAGQAGSGKDTVADRLVEEHGFVRIALADPLKRFAKQVFQFTDAQLWGPSHLRNGIDERFHHYGPKDGIDMAWSLAADRLKQHGRPFVSEILHTQDKELIAKHYSSLVHWFHWLGQQYHDTLSPRIVLQTLGTEWGREKVGDTLWIDYLLRVAQKVLFETGDGEYYAYDRFAGATRSDRPECTGVVISDARFLNEFAAVKNAGGSVIRLVRPETDSEATNTGIANHASETEQQLFTDYDFIVQNDGTLSELFTAVDIYVSMFKEQHKG